MRIFVLSGKMYFRAKNIDDAFIQLSNHFRDLSNGDGGIELLPKTDIKIRAKKPLYKDVSPMTPLSVGVETSWEKKQ